MMLAKGIKDRWGEIWVATKYTGASFDEIFFKKRD